MKKLLVLCFLLMIIGTIFAELGVNIPFDPDIVGPSFVNTGSYTYDSDWITITNIGSTDETYNLTWSFTNLPAGWTITVCNDLGLCYIPNMPAPIYLPAGSELLVHIQMGVNSAGGCELNITLSGGDLTEAMSFDFTFTTEDNVSADDIIYSETLQARNYPNPFNPSTTISFDLPQNSSSAVVDIYNAKGQRVKILSITEMQNNIASVVWNGTDENGQPVSSGIYYYKITMENHAIQNKMLLVK
jgi:hypothetical protein